VINRTREMQAGTRWFQPYSYDAESGMYRMTDGVRVTRSSKHDRKG